MKWRRSHRFSRHHIKNKCRGGLGTPENLILFDSERHKAFHFLFGNLDFIEVAQLLIRIQNRKKPSK